MAAGKAMLGEVDHGATARCRLGEDASRWAEWEEDDASEGLKQQKHELQLGQMSSMADRNDGIRAASRAVKRVKEEEEKRRLLTGRSRVWSERSEEGRSSRILPDTVQEGEDHVTHSSLLAPILQGETTLAAWRSRRRALPVEGDLRCTAPWRGASVTFGSLWRRRKRG
jgi:hypothetical protein